MQHHSSSSTIVGLANGKRMRRKRREEQREKKSGKWTAFLLFSQIEAGALWKKALFVEGEKNPSNSIYVLRYIKDGPSSTTYCN